MQIVSLQFCYALVWLPECLLSRALSSGAECWFGCWEIKQQWRQSISGRCCRTHTHDGKTSLLAAATEKATGTDSCAIIYFQGQTTKDAELMCSKATESETKHIVITAEEENSSHAPLLDGRSKDGDVNQSPLRSLQNSLLMLNRWMNGTRSATSLFLIAVAVVIVILILGIIAVMSSI